MKGLIVAREWNYFFVIVLATASTAVCQELAPQEKPTKSTAITFSLNPDPFGSDAYISARISYIDRDSPSLGWHTRSRDDAVTGESRKIRDSYIRMVNLGPEEVKALDTLFQERLDAHERNRQEISPWYARELDLELVKRGVPQKFASHASLDPPAARDIDAIFKRYAKAELAAERSLVSRLDEVLSPDKFAFFAEEWGSGSLLYIPIFAHFLELTEDQIAKVHKACEDAYRMELQLKHRHRDAELYERYALLLNNQEFQELRLRPYSYLTPKQFRRAAKSTLRPWRTNPQFSERLRALQTDNSVLAISELKVLGDLYKEGARLENANSN